MNEMLTEFTVIFTFIYIHGLRPSHDEDRIIDKEIMNAANFILTLCRTPVKSLTSQSPSRTSRLVL